MTAKQMDHLFETEFLTNRDRTFFGILRYLGFRHRNALITPSRLTRRGNGLFMGLSRHTGKKVQDGLESLTPSAVRSIESVKE